MKADKGKIPDEVKEILIELGNPSQAIPYYAIYGPAIDEPIKLEALIRSGQVTAAIKKARGRESVASKHELNWQQFSTSKLEQFREDNRLIFIQFMGPNDITIALNENVVLNTKDTKQIFVENDVIAMKADKGLIPDEVKEILIELGNPTRAIPFYAIFGPAIDEPIKLEAIITAEQVAAAIKKAKGIQEAGVNSRVAAKMAGD